MSDTPRIYSTSQNVWNAILYAGGEQLAHELWCSVIRLVAANVLARRGEAFAASVDDDEHPVDALICEWINGSTPQTGHFARNVPDDFFQDYWAFDWYEKVDFGAHQYSFDDDDLYLIRQVLQGYPDAQDALTKESLERCFNEWKLNVLHRVLHHARTLHPSKGGGSC